MFPTDQNRRAHRGYECAPKKRSDRFVGAFLSSHLDLINDFASSYFDREANDTFHHYRNPVLRRRPSRAFLFKLT